MTFFFLRDQMTSKKLTLGIFPNPRIIEAGTYLNSTRHIFPDWGNATMLNAKACYGDNDSACIMAGASDENDLRMTAMRLNETGMLYTRSYVKADRVWVAYVEEPFVE